VIDEMLVKVKSWPETLDSVEQLMSSLPVTVKVMVPDVDVAEVGASVTVGG
jgi:3'-phosphoadenosine 5'-phosphosulfate sulfotransferase (PAPS reductase)/FAD synthetase